MLRKFVVIFVFSVVSLTSCFIVNVHRKNTEDLSEFSEPRTVDKSFKLLYNLYKMFNSSHDKKPSKRKSQAVVPYSGLYYGNYDTYNDNQSMWESHSHEEETSVAKPDKKKKKGPHFWLFDKFAEKNNLMLLTKILLKLIIFKKVVKFIAVICLLFFVPTLADNSTSSNSTSAEENHSDNARNLDVYDQIDYRTKEILTFAIAAVEGFSQDVMVWCVAEHDAFCRFRTMFDNVDQIYTVDNIIRNWYPQSTTQVLRILDKIKPPKLQSTTPEAYLELPEDASEFPIQVSSEEEGSDESDDETNALDSEDDEEL